MRDGEIWSDAHARQVDCKDNGNGTITLLPNGDVNELNDNDEGHQLHAARYAYHKQIKHKYTMLQVLPPEQAREMYRLAMLNYDELIKEAVNGHMTEANELDMEKGIGL